MDPRWKAAVEPEATGISTTDVEGYLAAQDVEPLIRDFLLVEAQHGANVMIHVLPAGQDHAYPGSRLRLAADLALHRGARGDARAVRLLHELAHSPGTGSDSELGAGL